MLEIPRNTYNWWNKSKVFLTEEVSLVPQCSNQLEKQEQGPQSKKNLRLEYKEGYLIQQLASVAYKSKSNIL